MDSAEVVVQQPVSSVSDLIGNAENSLQGPAGMETTTPYAAQPIISHGKQEPVPAAVAELDSSVTETPSLQFKVETDKTDDGREILVTLYASVGADNIGDSSILAEIPRDPLAVQQIKDTVEVATAVPAGRSDEETVVVVSGMHEEAGRVEILIEQADGKSNAEGIDVEVVLNEEIPAVSQEDGPREDSAGEAMVLDVSVVGTLNNVDDNGANQHLGDPVNPGEPLISNEIASIPVSPSVSVEEDLAPMEGDVVALEETIDTTILVPEHGNRADDEDVDRYGVLVGVGSTVHVESRGLTITEIGGTSIIVEEFQAERQVSWGLSEPLVTPPEEELIEAIDDFNTIDNVVDEELEEEPPLTTEDSVLVITEEFVLGKSSNLQIMVDDKVEPDTINLVAGNDSIIESTELQTMVDDKVELGISNLVTGNDFVIESTDLQTSVGEVIPAEIANQVQAPLAGDVLDETDLPEQVSIATVTVDDRELANIENEPAPLDRPDEPDLSLATETQADTISAGSDAPLDRPDEPALSLATETQADTILAGLDAPLDRPDEPDLSLATEIQADTVSAGPDVVANIVAEPVAAFAAQSAVQDTTVSPEVEAGVADAASAAEENPIQDDLQSNGERIIEERYMEAAEEDYSVPASEADLVTISMSSYDAETHTSIDGSATVVIEQMTSIVTTGIDQDDSSIAEHASDVVASVANGSVPALDDSVLKQEDEDSANAMVPMEAAVASAELGIDEREASVLDAATDNAVDGFQTEETVEKNEKKRGRKEEEDAVADDNDKSSKTARTSNGEISLLKEGAEVNDVEIKEDAQVDKKRPREEEADVLLTKVLKTESADDVADIEDEADADDCEDMEVKEEEQVEEKSMNGSAGPRYKKRKIALFLGYSGAGYQGMQKNPGAITIEGELEDALYRAGAIAESNYGEPKKVDWRRAARTDKGVSAVGQVVSGCFFIDPPGFIERLNSHLPKQIRVYGCKRVTASFSAKKLCDRRKYEYVLPVYAFDSTVHLDRETAQAQAAAAAAAEVHVEKKINIEVTTTTISNPAPNEAPSEAETAAIIDKKMEDCFGPEEVPEVQPVSEIPAILPVETSNIVLPDVEGQDEKQSCSNGVCTSTEDVTSVTEITQGPVGAGEVLIKQEDVTRKSSETVSKEEVLDENVKSIAPGEVRVETEEVVTEREEVTVIEPVKDLSTEGEKEALDEKVKQSTFIFGEAEINRLNRILKGFQGHHNFHNFTARTKAVDPSANRYIISFEVENVFTVDGMEFVRCSVVGQSFMLHQIRKMIGLAVAIMRGTAPESILATALRRDTRINVPMAPELGLFLEECYYSAYNKRFKATHEEMSLDSFSAEVEEFKKEFIYPHIVSTEKKDSTFALWLHSLNDRHYPEFAAAREAEKLIKAQ